MLVLTRKLQESIQISDSIVVTVLEIQRNKVRIGIDAPKEIPVLRTELKNGLLDASRCHSPSDAKPKVANTFRGIEAWGAEGGEEN